MSFLQEFLAIGSAFLNNVIILRVILVFLYVFIFPGLAWTFVLFTRRQINVVERVALTVGLSVSLVTISIFALNQILGVRVTGVNSALTILVLIILPLIVYLLRIHLRKAQKTTT